MVVGEGRLRVGFGGLVERARGNMAPKNAILLDIGRTQSNLL